MKDYNFVPIPLTSIYFRHDFINGGHKWPICGTTETIILGTKGSQFLEPGYVWAPYIPITSHLVDGNVHVEERFQPNHGISSRYATATVNNRYYSTITFDGVQMPRVNRTFS